MAVFPTAALAITILAASLLGDGLRDAFDPTLKGR
jgi:ABC-type dipeptide/oligopeptide/nickel transport system permease subunit